MYLSTTYTTYGAPHENPIGDIDHNHGPIMLPVWMETMAAVV